MPHTPHTPPTGAAHTHSGRVLVWALWHPRPDVPDVRCLVLVDGIDRQMQLQQGDAIILTERLDRGQGVMDRAGRLRGRFEAKGFVSYNSRSRPDQYPHGSASATPALQGRLIALTEEARRGLGADYVLLKRLPFRVGREARLGVPTPMDLERRKGLVPPTNDLYITERPSHGPFQISHQHFHIEHEDRGFAVVDCRSDRGTIVGGVAIGGNRLGGRAPLADLDVVIIGSQSSPFVFKFRLR